MANKFDQIDFGFMSAEAESDESPHLLVDGFLDFDGAAERAQNGKEFLFLGYKGSGKTAIAKNILLRNRENPMVITTEVLLGDFPFTPFSKIIKGDIEPEAKYPVAWAWLLLIKILGSLSRDEGVKHSDPARFTEAINALREVGLLEGAELAKIVTASSKNNFSIKIPQIVEFERGKEEKAPPQTIAFYVESFLKLVLSVQTSSKHIIFVDGLDDIMSKRSVQYDSLGGLIIEIGRLNQKFRQSGVNVKINCLCRADLYEKISNPNLNKMKIDYSVMLDWFGDPNNQSESKLIHAINKRSAISIEENDVLSRYFLPKYKGTPAAEYILNHTRHTPRDVFQLMKNIQKIAKSSNFLQVTEGEMSSAIRVYSIDYFMPEIRDELSGYFDANEISVILKALEEQGVVQFAYDAVEKSMSKFGMHEERIYSALETLFNCSAISNVRHVNNQWIYTARYRNRLSSFKKFERIEVHKGLWKVLNLSVSRIG